MPLQKPFEVGDRVLVRRSHAHPVRNIPGLILDVSPERLSVALGDQGTVKIDQEYVIHAPAPKELPPPSKVFESGFSSGEEEEQYRRKRDDNLRGVFLNDLPRQEPATNLADTESLKAPLKVGDYVLVPSPPVGSGIWTHKKIEKILKATFKVQGRDDLLCFANEERTWRMPKPGVNDHPLDTCQCGDYLKDHGRNTDPPHQFALMEPHIKPHIGVTNIRNEKKLSFISPGEYTIQSTGFSLNEGKDSQISIIIDYSKAAPNRRFRLGDCVKRSHDGSKGFIARIQGDMYIVRFDNGSTVGYHSCWMHEFILDAGEA